MTTSSLFHLEHRDLELYDAPNYVVLSCLQWKSPALDVMPVAGKQHFAVMFDTMLEQGIVNVLEKVHPHGGLAAVKLVAAHDHQILVFVDSQVASSAVPFLESAWTQAIQSDCNHAWTVNFASVDELRSGRSDFRFSTIAENILDRHDLGLSEFKGLQRHTLIRDEALDDSRSRDATNYLPEQVVDAAIRRSFESFINLAKPSKNVQTSDDGRPVDLGYEHRAKAAITTVQCVHALSICGIRFREMKLMKVGDQFISHLENQCLFVCRSKAKPLQSAQIPNACAELIKKHIELNGLSEGDYLFPSTKFPGKPMTQREFEGIYRSWILAVGCKDLLTKHEIHKKILRSQRHLMQTALATELPTGHVSPRHLEQYLALVDASSVAADHDVKDDDKPS